jgi:hypothetical protein
MPYDISIYVYIVCHTRNIINKCRVFITRLDLACLHVSVLLHMVDVTRRKRLWCPGSGAHRGMPVALPEPVAGDHLAARGRQSTRSNRAVSAALISRSSRFDQPLLAVLPRQASTSALEELAA